MPVSPRKKWWKHSGCCWKKCKNSDTAGKGSEGIAAGERKAAGKELQQGEGIASGEGITVREEMQNIRRCRKWVVRRK